MTDEQQAREGDWFTRNADRRNPEAFINTKPAYFADECAAAIANGSLAFRAAQPGEGEYVPPHASIDYYRAQVVMLADALEKVAGHVGTMQREGNADFHAGCAAIMKDCLPVFQQVGMTDDGDGYGFDRAADETIGDASHCWGFRKAMRHLKPALAKPRPDREAVWLVERPNPPREISPHPIVYMLLDKAGVGHSWTADPQDASRFPSRCDAETHIGNATGLRAAEHIFGLSLLPAEPVQEMREGEVGRFGHHPEPAIDYECEIDALIGMAYERLTMGGHPDLEERIRKAMEFRVLQTPGELRWLSQVFNGTREIYARKPGWVQWPEDKLAALAAPQEQERGK